MKHLSSLALALAVVGGCTSEETTVASGANEPSVTETGATAVWRIDEADPPTEDSSSFTALVSRLECSSGKTGDLRTPTVDVEDDRIVVVFEAEPLPPSDYNCPGNDGVTVQVRVGVPIGRREIVDGACLSGDAVSTSFCSDGPVRWAPPLTERDPSVDTPAPHDPGDIGVACPDDGLVDTDSGQTYGRDPTKDCAFVDDDGNVIPDS